MTISISTLVLGPIENNTYLLADQESKIAAVIDPSIASRELLQNITNKGWHLEYILVTHAHFDHIGGVKWLKDQFKHEIKVALHQSDLTLWQTGGSAREFGFDFNPGDDPDFLIENNQVLKIGSTAIKVLHTPGHTPGHVTFSIENASAAFCGDLIFYHGIGRTDLKISSEDDLMKSIKEKIFRLDPKTTLYPGHGPVTTVQEEMENNPFF
jgi:hydroxyacylglutathione hydrolase